MVVHLDCFDIALMECETKIQIWKINTQEPEEEGIELLHVMSHDTALLSKEVNIVYQTPIFCVNDRFTVIYDIAVKVFGRREKNPLVCQIEIGNKTVKGVVMQGKEGDHLALALKSVNVENVTKFTVNVYSASRGDLIIQKEMNPSPVLHAPIYMKWFGDHLIVGALQYNGISFFSWQPALESFLSFPSPVVRRSPCGDRGDTTMWVANCLNVNFEGITTAIFKQNDGYFWRNVYFKTWKSSS